MNYYELMNERMLELIAQAEAREAGRSPEEAANARLVSLSEEFAVLTGEETDAQKLNNEALSQEITNRSGVIYQFSPRS